MKESCPFYCRLCKPDLRELRGHVQVFLDEKAVVGCDGIDVTEAMKVTVASQACLLLLHRDTDYFPGVKSVLLYPRGFQAHTTKTVGLGITEESTLPSVGYAAEQGAVVLVWDAVLKASLEPPYNVVLHEFAHFLDYEDGWPNGTPAIGAGLSRTLRKRAYATWERTLRAEFDKLREQLRARERTFFRPYAATHPAEFFAVATEDFFCRPREMRCYAPEMSECFKAYYRQDPSGWEKT